MYWYYPQLRMRGLHGGLSGIRAVRVTVRYRITLQIDNERQEITLLDIGSHDELYR